MPLKPSPDQSGDNVSWYIFTMAPYYAENTSGGYNFGSDKTCINATVFSNNGGDNIAAGKNMGIKMTHGDYRGHRTGTGTVIPHVNSILDPWLPVGCSNSPSRFRDTDYLQSDTYQFGPGDNVYPGFGPYDLALTPISTSPAEATGSVLLVTSGSEVLTGTNSGNLYSPADTRAFNILFYSTGALNAADLVEQLTGYTIANSWNETDRQEIYNNGYGLFQSYYDGGPKQGMSWYPGNYEEASSNRNIYWWNE
jgi:hypothetical protein